MAVVVITQGVGRSGSPLHRYTSNEVVTNIQKHLLDAEARAMWMDPKWRESLIDSLTAKIVRLEPDGDRQVTGLQAIIGESLHGSGIALDFNAMPNHNPFG